METHKAIIKREEDKTSLLFTFKEGEDLEIILTDDKPNEIKKVFNQLIVKLKQGEFNFELDDPEATDLFHHISKEYISQLNSELSSVYNELEEYELLELDDEIK